MVGPARRHPTFLSNRIAKEAVLTLNFETCDTSLVLPTKQNSGYGDSGVLRYEGQSCAFILETLGTPFPDNRVPVYVLRLMNAFAGRDG
jgi:hypothetical protein